MIRQRVTLLIAILINASVFGQSIDSIELCDMKIAVIERLSIDDTEELELDYNIKIIREYDKNGKIEKESFWLIEAIPIYETRFYKSNGEIKKIENPLKNKFDLCYAIKVAQESGLIEHENFYISIFDKKHPSDYNRHWFVGYENFDGDYWFETIGKVIDYKTGQMEDYHTITHDQPDLSFFNDSIFISPEQLAEFPGGMDSLKLYLQSSIKIPKDSIESGKVYVQFNIDKNGFVDKPLVIRGINKRQDAEALRIVREMPQWTPARLQGENVGMPYTVPIIFRDE